MGPPPLPRLAPPILPAAPQKTSRSKLWFLLLVPLPFLALAILGRLVFLPWPVPTGSMGPTLLAARAYSGIPLSGDRVLVNRASYLFGGPERGEVIVFDTTGLREAQVPQGQYYVKRVVGVPGDEVLLEPPGVRVNGQLLNAPSVITSITRSVNGYNGYQALGTFGIGRPVKLGPGQYFVLGDNSRRSLDSRSFGPIKGSQIVGRAVFVYAPLPRLGFLD